jgi:2-polyprenyl-6-methoxyphenol hydroxylase-like FAD-dependent oxidoreductase
VRAAGATVRHSEILTSGGRPLSALPADLLDGAVALHRGALQEILLEAAGEVRLGTAVASVKQTADRVVASAADGGQQHGDLLVAADGMRSLARAAIADCAPRFGGYTAWRGISPVPIEAGRLTESWGVGERFGLVDIGSQTYWFATANAPPGEPDDPAGRKAHLKRFWGWHAPIATVLEATPDSAILRTDVYFLEPLPRWSEGRIVLLGDAAHATTPGVGQGAAQALEDAVVLSDEVLGGDELPSALTRYESIRRPRAELTLKLSRRADRAAQLANPLGCRLRNGLVRHTPERVQSRALAQLVHHQLP